MVNEKMTSKLVDGKAPQERADLMETIGKKPIKDFENAFGWGGKHDATKAAPTEDEVEKMKKRINRVLLSVGRRANGVETTSWGISTPTEVAKVRVDFNLLGLPAWEGNTFYDNLFNQFAKSHSDKFLQAKATSSGKPFKEIAMMYKHPENNIQKIAQLDPEYYRSWQFFATVRDVVKGQNEMQEAMEKSKKDGDDIPMYTKVTDVIRNGGTDFMESVRERDWPRAGLYVVGFAAAYGLVKRLMKKDIWALGLFGVAAGTGLILSEHLGYDILKKFKGKDNQSEIKGTPLEPLTRLSPRGQDIDAKVYLAAHNIGISDLYNNYQNPDKPGFIDPKHYSFHFPKFRNKSKAVLKKDPNYQKTGEQLFLIIQCMIDGYHKMISHDPNENMDFGSALEHHPLLKNRAVLGDFAMGLLEYATPDAAKYPHGASILWWRGAESKQVFSDAGIDFEYNEESTGSAIWGRLKGEHKAQVIPGKLMGYPVIFREAPGGRLHVYSAMAFKGEGVPNDELFSIPFKGSDAEKIAALNDIKKEIPNRIKKVLSGRLIELENDSAGAPLEFTFGADLHYNNGEWSVDYELTGKNGTDKLKGTAILELDTEHSFDITKIYDKRFNVDLRHLESIEDPKFEDAKSKQECIEKLDKLGNDFGLSLEVMPVKDLQVLRMLAIKWPRLLSFVDYEDIISRIDNIRKALDHIKKNDPLLLKNLQEFTIFMGSQRLLQLFAKTEGVSGYGLGFMSKHKAIFIDYDEDPKEIAGDLREYYNEAVA
jgi:hypothetical protein